jgi:hypothetical protein
MLEKPARSSSLLQIEAYTILSSVKSQSIISNAKRLFNDYGINSARTLLLITNKTFIIHATVLIYYGNIDSWNTGYGILIQCKDLLDLKREDPLVQQHKAHLESVIENSIRHKEMREKRQAETKAKINGITD